MNSQSASRFPLPTIDDDVEDLEAIANHHGDDQISVYGAAYGAAIGMQAALSTPTRIGRLILQHGFARRRLSFFERLLASACRSSSKTLNGLPQRRRFQAVNHQPWFPPFDHSRFDFLVESTGALSLRELGRRAQAVHAFDISTRLGQIGCPVMLLRSEGEGQMAADSQDLLEKQIKSCRIEWMHSAGQHPYLTHPHRVAKLIQAFCVS